jgi:hypothetical protein
MNKGVPVKKEIKKDEKRLGSLKNLLTFAAAKTATHIEKMKRIFDLIMRVKNNRKKVEIFFGT